MVGSSTERLTKAPGPKTTQTFLLRRAAPRSRAILSDWAKENAQLMAGKVPQSRSSQF